jgi:hypothetical protein
VLIVIIGCIYLLPLEWNLRFKNVVAIALLCVCLSIPFLFLLPESLYINPKEETLKRPIPLSLLYHSDINQAPLVELRKGKHIISFMSLSCRFCRKAAKRLRIMKEKHPELPIYLVLNGDSLKLHEFFLDTKASNLPFSIFNGAHEFLNLNNGASLPTIKWVQDTTVVRESNYMTLDEHDILKWLKQ